MCHSHYTISHRDTKGLEIRVMRKTQTHAEGLSKLALDESDPEVAALELDIEG